VGGTNSPVVYFSFKVADVFDLDAAEKFLLLAHFLEQ
jgi:hypothetical protein